MTAGNLEELGKAFVDLGELLQDKSSTIAQLAEAAEKCGIRLGVGLIPERASTAHQQQEAAGHEQ